MKKLKHNGFTLVELVITIAIVIILSVISVPIYRGYVDKAKWSEAYGIFGTMLSAQKAYYSEYGNFLYDGYWTTYHPVLGIDARGNKYFTLFISGGGSNSKFIGWVMRPNELISNGMSWFRLDYDLTSGSTFRDDKAGLYS